MNGRDKPGPTHAGPPRALIVDGILEGRVLNEDRLQQAVHALSQCGAGAFRADVTGSRFSMLPIDTRVPPDRFDAAAQTTFLDRLQAVADAARPGSIESTLRCKLVYEHEVAETLFVARGALIEPLTRHRPRDENDDGSLLASDALEAPFGMRRRELLWLTPLLLVIGGVFLWQAGWIDRVLSASAEEIRTDTGPFGDMVTTSVERSWGNYVVTLARGAGYPETPAALAERRDASEDLPARAATEVVGNGDALYVRLVDADGNVLAEARTELRPLLTGADGTVEVKLPGRMNAHGVALALDAHQEPK